MKGEISSDREDLDSVLKWLERGIALAGLTVVVGLLLEYGPDVIHAIAERRWPSGITIGGILVTVGVFGEVLLGIVVTVYAGRVQTLADSMVEEARERAAKAGSETERLKKLTEEVKSKNLELATALAETERAMLPRGLNQLTVAEELKKFSGTRAIVETISEFEPRQTALLISSTLVLAGWSVAPLIVRTDVDPATGDFFRSGVIVRMGMADFAFMRTMSIPEARRVYTPIRRRFESATEALLKELNDNGIGAFPSAVDNSIAPDTVRILVSLKPVPGKMERGTKIFIAPGTPPPKIVIEQPEKKKE